VLPTLFTRSGAFGSRRRRRPRTPPHRTPLPLPLVMSPFTQIYSTVLKTEQPTTSSQFVFRFPTVSHARDFQNAGSTGSVLLCERRRHLSRESCRNMPGDAHACSLTVSALMIRSARRGKIGSRPLYWRVESDPVKGPKLWESFVGQARAAFAGGPVELRHVVVAGAALRSCCERFHHRCGYRLAVVASKALASPVIVHAHSCSRRQIAARGNTFAWGGRLRSNSQFHAEAGIAKQRSTCAVQLHRLSGSCT
jgi:hypothetical protein